MRFGQYKQEASETRPAAGEPEGISGLESIQSLPSHCSWLGFVFLFELLLPKNRGQEELYQEA